LFASRWPSEGNSLGRGWLLDRRALVYSNMHLKINAGLLSTIGKYREPVEGSFIRDAAPCRQV
jgi:hypothetical protein